MNKKIVSAVALAIVAGGCLIVALFAENFRRISAMTDHGYPLPTMGARVADGGSRP
jgi:hypothetical protein